jgi:DNA-binding response OmpR family regulator
MNSENVLRVVIVEDEPELRENLALGLASHGFEVSSAGDGRELDAVMVSQSIDIVLLDLGLPGEDGLNIAERLRHDTRIGVIMLTARGMTRDRIRGLDCGADNYFVKPVDIAELASAINSLARRLVKPIKRTVWRLHAEASCLHSPNGISISLTAQECLLMRLMVAKMGQNVSRTDIFQAIGQPPDDIYSNARLEVLISRLRSKALKLDPATPLPLRARHNMGYILLAENG